MELQLEIAIQKMTVTAIKIKTEIKQGRRCDSNRISHYLFRFFGRLFFIYDIQDGELQKHALPANHGKYVLEPGACSQHLQSHPLDIDDDFWLFQKAEN